VYNLVSSIKGGDTIMSDKEIALELTKAWLESNSKLDTVPASSVQNVYVGFLDTVIKASKE
jgi:hypothetical protein